MRPFPSLHVFLNATPLILSCGLFRRPSARSRGDTFAASYLHALVLVQTHVLECCAGDDVRAQTCMRRLFRSSPYGAVNTTEESDRLKNVIVESMQTLVDIERLMLNKMPYSKRVQWMRDHIIDNS